MASEIQTSLLKKAGTLLARRAFSRGELRLKLAQAAEESAVEAVLDRLEQLNLLNDADYAYNFASRRIKRDSWGPAKVYAALLRRHVAPATIEAALQRVRDEVGDDAALTGYLRRSWSRKGIPSEFKRVRQLIRQLKQRGFEEDTILRVLKRMVPAEIMRRLETGE